MIIIIFKNYQGQLKNITAFSFVTEMLTKNDGWMFTLRLNFNGLIRCLIATIRFFSGVKNKGNQNMT